MFHYRPANRNRFVRIHFLATEGLRYCDQNIFLATVKSSKSLLTMPQFLFACDELAGFITAVTYVRPSKTVDEVEVKSVKKKLKDKAFARAVSREDIRNGAEELDVSLEEHIEFCIMAMRKNKGALGL